MSDDRAVQAAAEALTVHHVALRRSDLTVMCDCGFDCDPCHWGSPWETHLAEVAVAAAREVIAGDLGAWCRSEWHDSYMDEGEEYPTVCERCEPLVRIAWGGTNG